MSGNTKRNKGGRPPKYTDQELSVIAEDLGVYIEENDDPTIVGFTSSYTKYPVNKQFISDRPEFSDLVKRSIEKQEAYLLRGATQNKLNPTMGIFRLKQPQHGYKDKSEVENTIKLPTPILGGLSVQSGNSNTQDSQPKQED